MNSDAKEVKKLAVAEMVVKIRVRNRNAWRDMGKIAMKVETAQDREGKIYLFADLQSEVKLSF